MSVIQLMAEDAGIDPARVTIQWVSGAEGLRFAEKVTEFTDKIRALGPNDFAGGHAAPVCGQPAAALPEEVPCP